MKQNEERLLIKQAQSKNYIEANMAMETLLRSNQGLIKKIANEFIAYDIEFDDLYVLGQLGFIKAVKEFDFSKKNKLVTFAYLWIKQSIQRGLSDVNMIYVPDKQLKLFWTIDNFKQEFIQSNGHAPSIDQIAKGLKISKLAIKKNNRVINQVYSLDKTINDEKEITQASLIADDKPNAHEAAVKTEAKAQLYTCLRQNLNAKQLLVIIWTYGLDTKVGKLTAKQIAKRLGVSVPTVRKIQYSTLALLKNIKELKIINENMQ